MTNHLWVVGEDDPDPDQWSIWSEYALVVAPSAEEALVLDGRNETKVAQIDMTKAQVLVSMPEPRWGEDL